MSAPLKPRKRKPLIAFLFILLLGSAYPLGLFVWMGTPLYFNHGLMPEKILTEEIPGRTGLARAENGEWQLVYNPCGADVEHVAVSDNMTGVFAVDSSVADATKRGRQVQVWTPQSREAAAHPFTARLFPPDPPRGWAVTENTFRDNSPQDGTVTIGYTATGTTALPARVSHKETVARLSSDAVLVGEYRPLTMSRADFFDCETLTPRMSDGAARLALAELILTGQYQH